MKKEGFSAISNQFAAFLGRLEGQDLDELTVAARMVCEAVNNGHVCLDLDQIEPQDFPDGCNSEKLLPGWSIDHWREQLLATSVVGPPNTLNPLILDHGDRLYLYRYWAYEQALIKGILTRSHEFRIEQLNTLIEKLDRYFPTTADSSIDWQRNAALLASTRSFCAISGGPGTGKTTTVVKILALLQEISHSKPLAIALAAPTGKAAARLKEAITRAKAGLPCEQSLREKIPDQVSTLHRLLGAVHHSPQFRHNQSNPLPYDVVVVDEASMIDLPMMAKLILALPEQTRLILLGDKDQLASVEAGAVLGDICRSGAGIRYSQQLKSTLGELMNLDDACFGEQQQTGPLDSLVTLQENYRFAASSGIGILSVAVNSGAAEKAAAILDDNTMTDVTRIDTPTAKGLQQALSEPALTGFTSYLKASSAQEALKKFNHFIILCALRDGPYGVTSINTMAEQLLAEASLLDPVSRWYRGRPIMVTSNDYNLGLFNGDTGIIWPDDSAEQSLRAWFPAADGSLRSLAPARLPVHETVFASTVHKSQGSEFDKVLLLLPGYDSQALTRELLYTGITRARNAVEIWCHREIFSLAVQRKIQRRSGLRDALWGEGAR